MSRLNRTDMRTLITTLALAACLGASAQSATTADARRAAADAKATERTTELTAELGLTAEQTEKLAHFNKVHYRSLAELETVRKEDRAGRENALKENEAKAMASILTQEQLTKWKSSRK